MTFSKSCTRNILLFACRLYVIQEIYFYLLVARLYVIRSNVEIKDFHSFIHFIPAPHALMNDFKSRSSEENITKSCIFESVKMKTKSKNY